jgi:glycosyltransferase involved in cell wall biosynthesis
LCPLFTADGSVTTRLGPDGDVLYSSLDGRVGHPYAPGFQQIERDWGVQIVYGRRSFNDAAGRAAAKPEVILIDVTRCNGQRVNSLKARLWEAFKLESDRYERSWDFEEYLRLAGPGISALHAVGACAGGDAETIIVSHEFMGMCTALAAMLENNCRIRTVYYAHEVPTVRRIVEQHPGHDTMFYNVMAEALQEGRSLEDEFGSQHDYYRHALVLSTRFCDGILAVGDFVVQELRFLGPELATHDIDLCYNGIPAWPIELDEAQASKEKLRQYAKNLLGCRPEYIFSHVARMTPSKGFWRDLRVLEHLERAFQKSGRTAVCFFLTTELPSRRPEEIFKMEAEYEWPLAHHEGLPDLTQNEAKCYAWVQAFNARSRNIRVLLVNQFGWERALCGKRMPPGMEFMDIRKGCDVEFGQSVYEPFGISQLEALSFGGLCVMSSVCGCAGFVRAVAGERETPNVIIADYTNLGMLTSAPASLLKIDRARRMVVERRIAKQVAQTILSLLAQTPEQQAALIRSGYELARYMTWEAVAEQYFLPAIDRACRHQRAAQVV